MANLLFCILHFIAFVFGFFGLFITIPLHIIYLAVKPAETLRADGKKRTGGLLGWMWDDVVVGYKNGTDKNT